MELMADLMCNFIRQRAEADAGQGHAFSVFIKFFRLQLGVAGIPDEEEVFVFHKTQFLGNCFCFQQLIACLLYTSECPPMYQSVTSEKRSGIPSAAFLSSTARLQGIFTSTHRIPSSARSVSYTHLRKIDQFRHLFRSVVIPVPSSTTNSS